MRVRDPQVFKAILDASGMSYRELATEAGCGKTMVYNLARGKKDGCTPELARRISAALQISVDLLFVADLSTTAVGQPKVGAAS